MKIGFLITARLKSKRLPLKIIRDLNGKTVIERLIDRIKEIKNIGEIILCTSTNSQDRPLVDIAKNNNIYSFNGDEEDVLQRLLDAALFYELDYFLGITADNPLISIYYSNRIINEVKKNKFDFIALEGLPLGAATYGVRTKALKVVCRTKSVINTEIWGYLINRPELFEINTIKATGKLNRPELRFTLDYEKDYEFINNLYSNITFKNVIDLYQVMDYLENNPEISRINLGCVQADLDEIIKREINDNYSRNMEKIKKLKNEIYHEFC